MEEQRSITAFNPGTVPGMVWLIVMVSLGLLLVMHHLFASVTISTK